MDNFYAIFEKVHDCDTRLAEIEGEIFLAYPSDPEDGIIKTLFYSKGAWRGCDGPEAELDADGEAAFYSSNGRPYRWAKVRWASSEEEARSMAERWENGLRPPREEGKYDPVRGRSALRRIR